jgi:hypothetical protein
MVKDAKSSDRFYGYGMRGDGLHDIYEEMGKDYFQRQKSYKEYVCFNRDKEEQEIREKTSKGIIGAKGLSLFNQ